MTSAYRLREGGRIERDRPLSFTFNGKRYAGYAGDTLASALMANGVFVVARSWKYHRPRGVVACGVEEPNALVQLESGACTIPNARATEVELYERLTATSVNCWPGVDFDLMAVSGMFGRLMPAGFYYKTFMWPKGLWMKYEHCIRKASGLGVAPAVADVDRYDKMNAHCDVLVVGAGPAGLAAALAAGRSGARVMLVDEQNASIVDREGNVCATDDRLVAHGMAHQIVAVERDIERARRHLVVVDVFDNRGNPLRQRHAAPANPDQRQLLDTPVAFEDFMRDSRQRAAHAVAIHHYWHRCLASDAAWTASGFGLRTSYAEA